MLVRVDTAEDEASNHEGGESHEDEEKGDGIFRSFDKREHLVQGYRWVEGDKHKISAEILKNQNLMMSIRLQVVHINDEVMDFEKIP